MPRGRRSSSAERRIRARVVSLPCWEWFEEQDQAYRDAVLPNGVPRLSVEAGASFGWERYATDSVSIDTFGASAPGDVVLEHFGFTPDNVAGVPPPWWAPPRPDSCSHPSDRPGARSSFRGVPVTPDPMEDEHGGSR